MVKEHDLCRHGRELEVNEDCAFVSQPPRPE